LEYFFFAAFDEKWKADEGDVGDNWGIFSTTRMPHPVVERINQLIPPRSQWRPSP
jgi:hypothetical protein